MMYENSTGFLIEISGVDGAGKSLLAQGLLTELQKRRYKCVSQDFFVRPLYLIASKHMDDRDDYSLKSLFSVNTANILIACDELLYYYYHTVQMIENGYVVISARSLWDRKIRAAIDGASNIEDLEKLVSLSPVKPKFQFHLKVSLENSLERMRSRGTDNENEVRTERHIYMSDSEAEKKGWIIIDANRYHKDVLSDVLSIVMESLN